MQKEQFELMLAMRDSLHNEANDLFREYRTMRQEIIGPKELAGPCGCNSYDYRYHPTNFEDDLPMLPEQDEWEKEWKPYPLKVDRMMEHCKLDFRCYLGYDDAYNSFKLPFRWLFDPNWKEEALTILNAEAERIHNHSKAYKARIEQEERDTLARLAAKYA